MMQFNDHLELTTFAMNEVTELINKKNKGEITQEQLELGYAMLEAFIKQEINKLNRMILDTALVYGEQSKDMI